MLKRFMALLLILACTLATACSKGEIEENSNIELLEPMNAKVETTYVTKMDISNVQLHDGAVVPSIEEFAFEQNGYLYGVFVQPGEKVYKGDVLAGIVGPDYEKVEDLEEEIKNLKEKKADIFKGYDEDLEITRLNGGDVSEKELEIKQKKELFEFEFEQKQKRLEEMKKGDIGYICIEAPYDAVVAAVSSSRQGSYISKGTPVVALENGGDPIVTCDYISENSYSKVYSCYAEIRGQKFELEYIPYTKNQLKVIVNNGVTPVSKFSIKDCKDKEFYVGDYAYVIEIKNFKADVLAVPQNAVYSDATGNFVYEIKDGERIRRPVTLGLSDSANVEITDGLEEGACIYVKS